MIWALRGWILWAIVVVFVLFRDGIVSFPIAAFAGIPMLLAGIFGHYRLSLTAGVTIVLQFVVILLGLFSVPMSEIALELLASPEFVDAISGQILDVASGVSRGVFLIGGTVVVCLMSLFFAGLTKLFTYERPT